MKALILSDLHLEFADFTPPETDADLVILGGDIGTGTHGLEWARDAFPHQQVVYVSGNHEHYGFEIAKNLKALRRAAQKLDIYFLENSAVTINVGGERARIAGATLWTDFKLFGTSKKQISHDQDAAARNIRDFYVIRDGERLLDPARTVEFHQASRRFIARELATPFSGTRIVVTHHCPSWHCVHPRFRNSIFSAAFASKCEALVTQANLWVHGHTHSSVHTRLGDDPERGLIICNPRGYRTYDGFENPEFDPLCLIEV